MNTFLGWSKGLGVAIGSAIAFSTNCAFCTLCSSQAIAQITPDTTLPNNSRVTTQNNIRIIQGGTQAGSNLFHSFEQFSVPTGTTAYFQNTLDIQNIISRVTGKSISNIDGTLQANGTANLFLINSNGIIFGPNASLNIGGSFVASTASSLNFADGIKFSGTEPQTTPLLTVSVPIGLQFGATAASIRNQSQVLDGASISNPIGLKVQPGKTLALVGGDIVQQGGSLTAEGGRIELGSVASNSLVSLNPTNQGWVLGYEGVQNFQNIQLIQRTVDGSNIRSLVNTSSQDGSGSIQVQGESVELIGGLVRVISQNNGVRNGQDITITARKLIVRDGAEVSNATIGQGTGGNLTVNASESVELIGSFTTPNNTRFSSLFSTTFATGKAGDITINTRKLRIQDGAKVSVNAGGFRERQSTFTLLTPGTGQGGNLNVNASESVEVIGRSVTGFPSSLFASTNGSGDAGKVTITTGQLIVQDRATVTVSSEVPKDVIYLGNPRNLGKAGELNISARSILLDNQGKLTSETDTGQGGDINLQVRDLLLLRRNSQISTNAGKVQAIGDGGNISINAPSGFIVAKPKENSDITANAFTSSGGRVQINATGLFGIAARSREDLARQLGTNDPTKLNPQNLLTNDITAISQTNPTLNGVVKINTPDIDVNRGLINLPVEPEEPRLAQGCDAGVAQNQSKFIITGRGGIPSNPREILRSNNVQVDWVSLGEDANSVSGTSSRETQRQSNRVNTQKKKDVKNPPDEIVEAQGWVVDSNGDVILVAQASTTTPQGSWLNSTSCK